MGEHGAFHFMGFVMHQPVGNLLDMLSAGGATANHARQILLAYERPVRYAERYKDIARFCVCFSGSLLEQLRDPLLAHRCADFLNVPEMISRYREAGNIELAGTGYFHPLFPLIPEDDWSEQIKRGRDIVADVFQRIPTVFWPPELGFSCNMIPYLVKYGYEQVICDGVHLRPEDIDSLAAPVFRAYIAEHNNVEIVLLPRDGFLSNALFGGTYPEWFDEKVKDKLAGCGSPALITTWCDGENGGWFRVEDEEQQFWGRFFAPYIERIKDGSAVLRQTSVSDFVSDNPPNQRAIAQTGTWQYEPGRSDSNFWIWAHLPAQTDVLGNIRTVSSRLHRVRREILGSSDGFLKTQLLETLEGAVNAVLRAEASDNFYHAESWLWKSIAELNQANSLLDEAEASAKIRGERT